MIKSITCLLILFISYFHLIQAATTTSNEITITKDVYELGIVCWAIAGVNILGMLLFMLFGHSPDPKIRREHGLQMQVQVKVTYVDAM